MCDITKEYIISSYVSDLRGTAMTAMQTHHIHTSSHDAIEEENNLSTPEVLQVNIIVPPPFYDQHWQQSVHCINHFTGAMYQDLKL